MSLGDMSLDEFMGQDWGHDSTDEEVKATEKRKKVKSTKIAKKTPKKVKDGSKMGASVEEKAVQQLTKSKTKPKHQQQLDKLKQKDPEFYKFLQEEESNLLEFRDIDVGLSDSENDEEEGAVHELPESLECASSDSEMELPSPDGNDDENVSSKKKKKKPLIKVTSKLLEGWKSRLVCKQPSLTAFRQLTGAFHAALAIINEGRMEEEKPQDKKLRKDRLPQYIKRYEIVGAATFNAVVGLCIQAIPSALSTILDYHPEELIKSKKKRFPLPSTNPKWNSLHNELRSYLQDTLTVVQILMEPSVIRVFLRHLLVLLPYFVSFPRLARKFCKVLVKFWSTSDNESIRVLAFFCLSRLIKTDKNRHLENTMKYCYLSYVDNCKFTSPSTLPMINFMQQTFTETCAVDHMVTYRFAFLYIRQLAILLRKAILTRNKETRQAVYNWQYIHSISLWCRVLSVVHPSPVLQPLIYPLVQIAVGIIDVVPTTRFFPLRFKVLQDLTALGNCTNTYIPLLSLITAPLQLAEFKKKPQGISAKSLPFETMLKFSGSQIKERVYRDGTIDKVFDLLMAYFNSQAHTIAFPEMVVPTMVMLKKFVKECQTKNFCKVIKNVVEYVKENAIFIEEKRQEATFRVKDIDAVAAWEESLKEEGVPFMKHYEDYKVKRTRELVREIADRSRIVEERLPTVDRNKFMASSKENDKKELSSLFAGDEDEEENFEAIFDKAISDGGFAKVKKGKPSKETKLEEDEMDAAQEDEKGVNNDNDEDSMGEEDSSGDEEIESDMEDDIVEDLKLDDI